MLDFSFSEEQELFRKTLREFARAELAPKYAYWDQTGEYPREQVVKMAALGLMGLLVPSEYGGMQTDCVTVGIAVEEIARGDFNCSSPVSGSALACQLLNRYANEDLRRELLPPLARGEIEIALAITEPNHGTDAAAIEMRAVRDGDDYVINGEKTSVTLATAEHVIVFAKTDAGAGARGISAFVVSRNSPGYSTSIIKSMGSRAGMRGSMVFDNVRVPRTRLLGEEGKGFYYVMGVFDYNRAIIGLMCLGCAEAALEDAMNYAKQRTAFGRPLAKFEAISFAIAEHWTYVEAARLLCYKTLWLKDHGLPHSKEAAMCKWWAPKVAVEAANQVLLIHGNYGYSQEYPHEQRVRDLIGWQIGDGTAEASKIVIGRELMGREYRPY